MTEPVPAPSQSLAGSFGAVAMGSLIGAVGFLAATAEGMATAPSRWAGVAPMALMAAGFALALLGLAALLAPHLRPAAKKGVIAALIGVIGFYAIYRLLMIAGLYDG